MAINSLTPVVMPTPRRVSSGVRVDQVVNYLLLGITPPAAPGLPPGQVLYDSAPIRKKQVQVDVFPSPLGILLQTVATVPFLPYQFLPSPRIRQEATASIHTVAYIVFPPVATLQTGPALVMPTPLLKKQVFAEQLGFSVILALPPLTTAALPPGTTLDTSQLQPKKGVRDISEIWARSLILQFPPKVTFPFTPVDTTRRQFKYNVYDQSSIFRNSQLPVPIPNPIPPILVIEGLTRPGGRVILNPKKQGETLPIPFDFISSLGVGEIIASAAVFIRVYSGVDPTPNNMLAGSPSISGTEIIQEITGGVIGVIYGLLTRATTNLGNMIEISAFLAVEPDSP